MIRVEYMCMWVERHKAMIEKEIRRRGRDTQKRDTCWERDSEKAKGGKAKEREKQKGKKRGEKRQRGETKAHPHKPTRSMHLECSHKCHVVFTLSWQSQIWGRKSGFVLLADWTGSDGSQRRSQWGSHWSQGRLESCLRTGKAHCACCPDVKGRATTFSETLVKAWWSACPFILPVVKVRLKIKP